MKELITVQSAAQKWSITPRRVQILCNEGRIDGAIKKGGVWFIPAIAPKPARQSKLCQKGNKKSAYKCFIFVFRMWGYGFRI